MTNHVSIEPGSIIHVKNEIASDRYFRVHSVCLGAEGQRDVVEVVPADERDPVYCPAGDGKPDEARETVHVPLDIVRATVKGKYGKIYQPFDADEQTVYSKS